MKAEKVNSIKFMLTEEECGRDDVEFLVEYKVDNTNPQKGNCFVDYWINFTDFGFRSHVMGIWLKVTKENLLSKIKMHMLRNIETYIKEYEKEVMILEDDEEL